MSEDNRLLLSVGAVVVIGAVGIALLASLSAREDSDRTVAVAETATPASYRAVTPPPAADRVPERSPALDIEESLGSTTAGVEAPFVIEPGEDLVARGLESYRSGDYERATAYFEAEVGERAGVGWTEYMLALSLWKSGRLDEAASVMARSIESDPDSVRARVNLSRIDNDRGEFERALEAARAALAIDEQSATARFLEARSLRNLGKRDEALRALEASLAIDPDNGWVQNLYGLTLLEVDRESEAVTALSRAAELEPDVAFIANNLGMALERAGRNAEALASYRRAVELDDGHVRAAANLARLEPLVPVEPTDPEQLAEPVAANQPTILDDVR